MEKTFIPTEIEAKWYQHWEEGGAFAPSGAEGAEPYVIIMPPPNVTGSLHMGHALDNSLQDILIRFERLRGRDVLWQPGTDHAGIATQMLVERQLDAEGIKRTDLGRENFLDRVWAWKEESGGTITSQLRRLGASCDWSREAFTMDDPRQKAVTKKFVELFKRGLIYRDKRLVNWDPKLKTAISDLEVEQKEVQGNFWHFRYPLEDGSGHISIATTRPETILGDGAVAVHPDDERYKHLVGQKCRLPIVDRLIPIIADTHVQMDFGSGAVKITAAHDHNDYAIYKRHPDAGIPLINLMTAEATMNENCPAEYQGLDRYEAREKVVAAFDALGLLDRIEPHTHMVPYGDRSGVVIEPWLTDQWYVDAETMAKPAIEAVETGKTRFIPATWEKTYFEWMRNIQPWCVSRQLWWGHRIPAWYAPDGTYFVAENAEDAAAQARAKFGEDVALVQEEDVLDTWFSSAMWPYSTMGWPEDTTAMQRYFPGSTLVTGFDIIFFWVARMMMSSLEFTGEVPFKDVYIHALVRDEHGAKMSKSKGNVINPIEFIDTYGADALRFTLAAMEAQGRDIKLSEKRVEGYRNFGTKLWNAARFCHMNGIGGSASVAAPAATTPVSKWIIAEAQKAAAKVTQSLDSFRFNEAADAIYHFTWGTFCDWYIELIKPVLFGDENNQQAETKEVTAWVLDQILTLLHPFMPFITEEIWHEVADRRDRDLIAAQWPQLVGDTDDAAAADINWLLQVIGDVRSARTESNIPPSAQVSVLVVGGDSAVMQRFDAFSAELGRLARVERVEAVSAADIPKASIRLTVAGTELAIPLEGVLDLAAEAARLDKVILKLEKEAGGIRGRLGNDKFIAKAPEHVVAEARTQLTDLDDKLAKAKAARERLD